MAQALKRSKSSAVVWPQGRWTRHRRDSYMASNDSRLKKKLVTEETGFARRRIHTKKMALWRVNPWVGFFVWRRCLAAEHAAPRVQTER